MNLRLNNGPSEFHSRIVKRAVVFLISAFLVSVLANGQVNLNKIPISYDDVPAELHPWLQQQGINRENFADHISTIRQNTDERERMGEYDHLIFFLLQSSRFTSHPRVEPAISAYDFVHKLDQSKRKKLLAEESRFIPSENEIPKSVKARMADFIKAIKSQTGDDIRLSHFNNLLIKAKGPDLSIEEKLLAEYSRAMRFLYLKEFASREIKQTEVAAYVASLYQSRGHSTDTQIEANFAVNTALIMLKALRASTESITPSFKLNKVLIVGPGLDFAPRTDLIDLFGPQSYQPFAVADALISLKLADESRLQIHCVDINERVLAYLQNLRRQEKVSLFIVSGVKDNLANPLAEDFKSYFREFGRNIGDESRLALPDQISSHLSKSLLIRPEIIRTISADRLNIIVERYQNSPHYDLVIVTNVFPYFNQSELLFALTNIAAMITDGGYFIHNELQTIPPEFIAPLGLPLQQARTVMISSDKTAPLFDGVAIHRKSPKAVSSKVSGKDH